MSASRNVTADRYSYCTIDLEDTDDLSGFSFLMKFEPTGDVIGYDIVFE